MLEAASAERLVVGADLKVEEALKLVALAVT